jgi:predicted PurR-regulated permease PerM
VSRWDAPLWYDRLAGVAWRLVIVVVACGLFVTGIVAFGPVILPVVLGLLFACGLQPIVTRLRRRGVPPAAASAVAVLALVAAVAAVVWLTVTAVIDQWDDISTLLANGRETVQDAVGDMGVTDSTADDLTSDSSALVESIVDVLVKGLVQLVPAVAGIVATVLLSLVVAYFFLKEGSGMWAWIVDRVDDHERLSDRIGQHVWSTLSGFIRGQTIIATVDASLIAIGAVALRVPHPGAVFVLTLFGAYIPFIGAFLSGLLAVLLALADSGLGGGAAMLGVVVVVQLLEGNLLQPWIQGRAVRLHPLVVALAVTAGGALAGFLGVFLAVPVTAAAFVTLSELRRAGLVAPATRAQPSVGKPAP